VAANLDLSSICQQMISDEESCPYVAIITQKGLYRYVRLPFGVSTVEGNDENTMTDSTTIKIQLKSQIIQL